MRRTIAAVGDVLVDRTDPGRALEGVQPVLAAADLVFGNFEGVLTDTFRATPGAPASTVVATANAVPLSVFDVMSLANNHAMDAGYGGLADTTATLAARGVRTVGAGMSSAEALRPVTVRVGERRVAVVACTSVLAVGAQAGPATPGVASLRAEDCYAAPVPGCLCPGVPAKVVSVLDDGDWARVEKAITDARARADVVVVSVHWGDHTRPWVITDHERLCAELIAAAGADLVLGHHHHALRGAEFIGGTPVFYGLGHIVFDMPRFPDDLRAAGFDIDRASPAELVEVFGEYGFYPRPDNAAFPFHPSTRITAVALVELDDDGIGRCGLVPCLIDLDGIARPVARSDARWAEVLGHLRESMARPRLGTEVVDRGETFAGCPLVTLTV
ncbi:CapA family protein [Streptomyces sp. NPDC020719]|uniref:CapA family protein n=1 Tax=Streptomyces sp. NPDC020719 TaxID=3154896 RepID=UPI0033C5FAD5